MKIIKNILITLGTIFSLLIVLVVFLVGESADFKEDHEQFVVDYTNTFSQAWNVASVSDVSSNDFLTQIKSPNGKQAVNAFSSLGKLVDTKDMQIDNYNSNVNGTTTASFKFKANFEHGKTLVTITVVESDGHIRVQGMHIETLDDVSDNVELNV